MKNIFSLCLVALLCVFTTNSLLASDVDKTDVVKVEADLGVEATWVATPIIAELTATPVDAYVGESVRAVPIVTEKVIISTIYKESNYLNWDKHKHRCDLSNNVNPVGNYKDLPLVIPLGNPTY